MQHDMDWDVSRPEIVIYQQSRDCLTVDFSITGHIKILFTTTPTCGSNNVTPLLYDFFKNVWVVF